MKRHRLTQAEFGRRVGVSQGQVGHWLAGRVRITAERAKQISTVTGEEVPSHELRPDIFGPPPANQDEPAAAHEEAA